MAPSLRDAMSFTQGQQQWNAGDDGFCKAAWRQARFFCLLDATRVEMTAAAQACVGEFAAKHCVGPFHFAGHGVDGYRKPNHLQG